VNSNNKQYLFDYGANSSSNALWAASTYTSGSYTSVSYILDSNYKGDWIIIKLPYPIILTKFSFVQSTTNLNNAPGKWKCYGSNDGINWKEITYASQLNTITYPSNIYTQPLLSEFDIPYLYIGWVVNSLLGAATQLIFSELQIFGKDDISNSYLNVWNKSNTIIYNTLGNVGIGTNNPISKLHIYEPIGTFPNSTYGTLTIQHGNNGGCSSIVFPSSFNYTSDYGYILYKDNTGSGEIQN